MGSRYAHLAPDTLKGATDCLADTQEGWYKRYRLHPHPGKLLKANGSR